MLFTMRALIRPFIVVLRKGTKTIFAEQNLLYTNIGLSVGISVLGDGIQQVYRHSKENPSKALKWEVPRTLQMAGAGFVAGPFAHYWYYFLDKFFPGRNLRTVLIKLCLDQFICSPIWVMIFLVTTGILQGQTWKQFKEEVRCKSLGLLSLEFLIWPPAQFINFFFLPTKYRVLYDNTVSLLVEVFYSYVRYDYRYNSELTENNGSGDKIEDNNSNKKFEEVSSSSSAGTIHCVQAPKKCLNELKM